MIKPHPVGLKEGAPFTVADDEDWNRSEVEAPDLHDDAGQSRKPRAFRKVDMRPAFRQTQRMNRKYHMSGHFGTFACLLIENGGAKLGHGSGGIVLLRAV